MSDPDPDVTPEQEAQLRRLLARARHDEPVPDDVAARLDRVLAQLGQEDGAPAPAPAEPPADVVDLHHRRRRRAAAFLVAAAAVVVVGVGLTHLPGPGSDDASTASAPAADATAGGRGQPAPGSVEKGGPGPAPLTAEGGGVAGVRLTERGFTRQVARLAARGLTSPTPGPAARYVRSCRATSGPGTRVPASYDGVPALLVFRAPTATTQVVELQRCGTGEVLRSTTLAR